MSRTRQHRPSLKKDKTAEIQKLELQGVSVHWLRYGLLREVKAAGLSIDSKIYELENLSTPESPGVIRRKGLRVPCPIATLQKGQERLGAAYVHCLEGVDNVGGATHMLSYTWGYTIAHIVETLESFCTTQSLNSKRTYIWICCLCNNQHKIVENRVNGIDVPTAEFETTFQRRVLEIGRIICMMSPWDEPLYLSRVWCIFEIYTALMTMNSKVSKTSPCEVFIEMPPSERDRMFQEVVVKEMKDGTDKLYQALARTRVERANASVEADKTRILSLLAQHGGISADADAYADINGSINTYLREWVRYALEAFIHEANAKYKAGTLSPAEYSRICGNVGLVFRSNGEFEAALRLCEEDRSCCEVFLGKNHRNTATAYSNKGSLLQSIGWYNEAYSEYCKALNIRKSILREDHPDIAATHNDIGSVLINLGRHEEAYEELRTCLSMLRKGEASLDNAETAKVYENVGVLLQRLGHYDEALVVSRQGLRKLDSSLGSRHPHTALAHNNIGSILQSLGRYPEALDEFEKGLSIQHISLGMEHKDTAISFNNVGSALRMKGEPEKALKAFRKALSIQTVVLRPDHPHIAASYNNIGIVLKDMSRYDEALVVYRKALSIHERSYGVYHPSTASSHSNIGVLFGQLKRFDDALGELQKALAIQKSVLGESHPDAAQSLHHIGSTLSSMGRCREALPELEKALSIRHKLFGANHVETLNTLKLIQWSKKQLSTVTTCVPRPSAQFHSHR